MINKRLIFCVIFWVSIFALWGSAGYKALTVPVIETDILALLPANKNSKIIQHAEKKIAQPFQQRIVILVGQKNAGHAVKSADTLREKLLQTNLFSKVETKINVEETQKLLALYRRHNATHLTPHQRKILENDDLPSIRRAAIANLYGGLAGFDEGSLKKDPLRLSNEAITTLISKNVGDYILIDDVPTIKDGLMHYALLRIELAKNPFSLVYQKKVVEALDTAQSEITSASFLRGGFIFHAVNGAEQAKTEISTMGTLSLIGVFLLLTLTFKSTQPFFFSALTIAGGAAFGFAACLLFFEKVHLLTLVFGTGLIGISIDYMLHFFAHKYEHNEWDAHQALNHIFSGISLGLITSIVGFLSLCFTPFASLQQMAIFSIAGLFFVYGVVVFVYPTLFKKFPQIPNPLPFNVSTVILKWWQQPIRRHTWRITLIAVIVMLCIIPFLKGQDDIRAMQSLSPQLVKNDTDIARLLGAPIAAQFVIVTGENDDDLLVNTSNFTTALETSQAVESHRSLVDYILPKERQMDNVKVLLNFVARHESALKVLFKDLSMPDSTYNDYISYLQEQTPLKLSALFENAKDSPISILDGGTFDGKRMAFITLNGVQNSHKLAALTQNYPHAIFVDKAADITALFDHHRVIALRLIVAAYILVFAFLCFRYTTRQSMVILLPSIVSSLIAIITLSFIGGHYSLFHVLALFLVMGIGVDYGLFLVESQRKDNSNSFAAMTAVTLSTITTLLSFGLLATSKTSALHDFGIVIVIGITLTFILSPMVLIKDRGQHI